MEQIWSDHLDGAQSAVALDIHTGLGPLGRLTMFQKADETEPSAATGAAWFPAYVYRSDRTLSVDHGLMGPGFDEWAAGRLDTAAFVVEFGTLEPADGVKVFRADNWLHAHGDPASKLGLQIRQNMLEFFFVEDEGWRQAVADQGMEVLHQTLDGIAAGDRA